MKSFTRIKKINGQEYLYEITPYYDKEKKQIRQKSVESRNYFAYHLSLDA